MIDYYEFLQISPNADSETIHRVYKYLAARLHPDNVNTGDAIKFQVIKAAYDVLSDPTRRAEFDAKHKRQAPQPLSTTIDFMDQLEGELNRRMAVLAVFYYRRRTHPGHPEVKLAEIEELMGFPRDYLEFTMWYLVKKQYVTRADNASFSLTADGVDFVEKERVVFPVLNGLLSSGTGESAVHTTQWYEEAAAALAQEGHPVHVTPAYASAPIDLPSEGKLPKDRRAGKASRRVGEPDLRIIKVERRKNMRERQANG
jgi:curved DNA-binding protein CbpA